jgi:hypothetical protein
MVCLAATICSTAADFGIVPWHLCHQGKGGETEATEGWLERGKKKKKIFLEIFIF